MKMFNSVKFKIGVFSSVILGIILIVYSSVLYLSLRHTLYNDLDKELIQKADLFSDRVKNFVDNDNNGERSLSTAAEMALTFSAIGRDKKCNTELEKDWLRKTDKLDLIVDYIVISNDKGKILVGSKNANHKLLLLFVKKIKKAAEKTDYSNISFNKRHLRLITLHVNSGKGYNYILQIATSIKPLIHILNSRMRIIVISIPLIVLFASMIGRFLAVRILRPVAEIVKTANKITYEDLSARVETKKTDEEMSFLVESFNGMIARLEKSFKYIGEFSSLIAHELKTPLAIIRGDSEITMKKERATEEYKRVINVCLEETERMIKTVDSMLLLARLDNKSDIVSMDRLDLVVILKEVCEQCKILAVEKAIAVITTLPDKPVYVNANAVHLRRLFLNIIHNAIKFNVESGKIHIALDIERNKARVLIEDSGIGIDEEQLPRIFDKFFRIQSPNIVTEPGSGLGLAIALSIAEMHKANLIVNSQKGTGSKFTIIIPYTP